MEGNVTATSATTSQAPAAAPASGGSEQGQARETSHAPSIEPRQASAPSEGDKAETGEKPQKRYLGDDADEALVKVKIDGKEQELTVKELKRLTSLEKASRQRMSEAIKAQKEMEQHRRLIQSLQENPAEVIQNLLGDRFDELAEERLAKKYEMMQMSPEQRALAEAQARIEAMERAEYESKRGVIDEIKALSDAPPRNLEKYSKEDLQNYRDHLKAVQSQARETLEQEILGAWKESGLPQDKRWGILIAQEMLSHEKSSGEPLQAHEAASKVKGNWLKFNRQIYGQMDAKAIHEALGSEVVEKLREHLLERVSSQTPNGYDKMQAGPGQAPASEPKKIMNEIEWRRHMGLA